MYGSVCGKFSKKDNKVIEKKKPSNKATNKQTNKAKTIEIERKKKKKKREEEEEEEENKNKRGLNDAHAAHNLNSSISASNS